MVAIARGNLNNGVIMTVSTVHKTNGWRGRAISSEMISPLSCRAYPSRLQFISYISTAYSYKKKCN